MHRSFSAFTLSFYNSWWCAGTFKSAHPRFSSISLPPFIPSQINIPQIPPLTSTDATPPLFFPPKTEDERSIANRLELESKRTDADAPKTEEEAANKIDATLPAKLHGNEPSKGAKIDQQIREEEEEELRKKDEAKKQSKEDKKH